MKSQEKTKHDQEMKKNNKTSLLCDTDIEIIWQVFKRNSDEYANGSRERWKISKIRPVILAEKWKSTNEKHGNAFNGSLKHLNKWMGKKKSVNLMMSGQTLQSIESGRKQRRKNNKGQRIKKHPRTVRKHWVT